MSISMSVNQQKVRRMLQILQGTYNLLGENRFSSLTHLLFHVLRKANPKIELEVQTISWGKHLWRMRDESKVVV